MTRCDLVLEGGGVKGIALVGALSVLEERGYAVQRVAGTSAGAIVGALVAAGMPASRIAELVEALDYRKFRDRGPEDLVPVLGPAVSLLFQDGVYEGRYLKEWLTARLAEQSVHTFADLRITDDPGTALPPERRFRFVAVATDVTRGRLVALPWEYDQYGLTADAVPVEDAVRASMSIPFFFEPVKLRPPAGRERVLVDGGLLSNFPVQLFDRRDDRPPRWPTFGIKLSARQSVWPERDVRGPAGLARAMLETLIGHADRVHVEDPDVVERTIFVDTLGVRATDFDLDRDTARRLFANGRAAAEQFLQSWDWDAYLAGRTARERVPE
ncbi:patatin-like phospholipase family protein [Georgenia thermotolerans]|uniref:Esterase n=1 Tax=Georgenia thermotolerans TaxID=527326 RepID=A0A7J5UNN4_9MICO|nr:patatin-like phospholipase family protein [Georgenia thermotolerans]KAE8764008.1 esterase [Georgenia thermotolerans]